MKKNGFSQPLQWQQVLAWIAMGLNILVFYIFTQPIITIVEERRIINIFFALLSFIVCLIGFIATIIDPSDIMLKEEIEKRKQADKEKTKYMLEISKKYDFCVLCCSNVSSTAKHCKICNRCVDNFDHHCNWLNNCIGNQNYHYFFVLLIIVLIDLIFNISVFLFYFIQYLHRTTKEEQAMVTFLEDINLSVSPLTCAIISVVFSVLDFVVMINIIYLIYIHTWLRCKGMTTYEYIIKYLIKEEELKENENKPQDNSESIMLKVNKTVLPQTQNKGRNKVVPDELMNKIHKMEEKSKLKVFEQNDKIIIDDYNNKIFKPIVDDIYFPKNLEKNIKDIDSKDIQNGMPNAVSGVKHPTVINVSVQSNKFNPSFERIQTVDQ
jgi:hypothetical protein